MPNIVTNTAVLGRIQLMPGIQQVTITSPAGECLVAHAYPARIKDPVRGIDVDVSDCTVFTVTHLRKTDIDVAHSGIADELLEQALQAISEVTIWNKVVDQVGELSAFVRQVGRLDVKFFFIEGTDNRLIGWKNPLYSADRKLISLVAGLLGNMVVTNGPSVQPVPVIVRRVMSSLDLINLGFYTESFVNLFSLVDDLTQVVIKSGLGNKGLAEAEQESMLRAIKEERLKHFLANLAKVCDWKSLEEENTDLFRRLLKANRLRNDIMHGSKRITRTQAIQSADTLLEVIDWLRINPFGISIPEFPLLKVAEAEFVQLEAESDGSLKVDSNESLEADGNDKGV